MRRIYLLLVLLCTLCYSAVASAAQVTDVKWGVDQNNGLRLVVDITDTANYSLGINNDNLVLTVKAPLQPGAAGSKKLSSSLADTMEIKSAGQETQVILPLKRPVDQSSCKSFFLKKDPATGRPFRVVLDIANGGTGTVLVRGNDGKMVSVQVGNKPQSQAQAQTQAAGSSTQSAGAAQAAVGSKPQSKSQTQFQSQTQAQATNKVSVQANVQAGNAKVSVGNAPSTGEEPKVSVNVKPGSTTVTVGSRPATSFLEKAREERLKKELQEKLDKEREKAERKAKEKAEKEAKEAAKRAAKEAEKAKEQISRPAAAPQVIKGDGSYRTDGGLKGKIIALDPGHGGSDPGAIGPNGVMEKDITLAIGKKMRELLEKRGAKVVMTRTDDRDVQGSYASAADELQARVNIAEAGKADVFISLHINSSTKKDVGGFTSYYYPKTSHDKRLAMDLQLQLTSNFGIDDMGVREANFYVIKRCSMPAVLLELCFISNAKEEKLMQSNWFQNKTADLLVEGVAKYFK